MPNYPDAATLLIDWAKDVLDVVNACHELPTNYAQTLEGGPLHVIERFGGGDTVPGLDVAHVAVATYGVGREGTLHAAETLRRGLFDLRGTARSGVAFSRIATISAPTRRPFDSRQVVLVTAVYQLHLHAPL